MRPLIVDVNLLIHAIDQSSPQHDAANRWLAAVLSGNRAVRLPWVALTAFVRITTNARWNKNAQSIDSAFAQIAKWLRQPNVKVIEAGPDHLRLFEQACLAAGACGNLVMDANYAALAIEHDCELASTDTDFSRLPGLRWVNPLATAP
jgi:toxin-antitoxin system PIN domain toxin